MNKTIKAAALIYLLLIIGCAVIFFNQQSIIRSQHISPGMAKAASPIAVQIEDKASGEMREAKLIFLDDSGLTNPLRMWNEIEEQLMTVFVALFATGVLLVLVAFRTTKQMNQE